jgi:hypothetical protein
LNATSPGVSSTGEKLRFYSGFRRIFLPLDALAPSGPEFAIPV